MNKRKLFKLLILILSMVIMLSVFVSCDKENIDYSKIVITSNDTQINFLENEPFLGNFVYNKELTFDSLNIKLANKNNDEIEFLDKDNYSINFKLFNTSKNVYETIKNTNDLIPGEYLAAIKYGDKTTNLAFSVLKEEKNLNVYSPLVNTSWEYGKKPVSIISADNAPLRYIRVDEYNSINKSNYKDELITKSKEYNSDSKLDIGEYYVFSYLEETQYYNSAISNKIFVTVTQANSISFEIKDEENFVLTSKEYEERILLSSIEFDKDNVCVKDASGNIIEGDISWENGNEIIDCGVLGAYLKFVPKNKNYSTIKKFITFNNVIRKKIVEKPSLQEDDFTYTGEAQLVQLTNLDNIDLFKIVKDDSEINLQENNAVIDEVTDANNYTYKFLLKDPRNYIWANDDDAKFDISVIMNKAEGFIVPININAQSINNEAKIKLTKISETGSLHISDYLTISVEVDDTKTNTITGNVEIIEENNIKYLKISNIEFSEGTSGEINVKFSVTMSENSNFKPFTKTVTISIS